MCWFYKINKLLNNSTDNAADYIYNLSSAIGKVKGAYDYGEKDGMVRYLLELSNRAYEYFKSSEVEEK
ncbi:hypothetical protein KAT08_02335 [Candidatus Babeliales bacterium]|nr:hypothetical protein [Candidatus Babeliales bacterium]